MRRFSFSCLAVQVSGWELIGYYRYRDGIIEPNLNYPGDLSHSSGDVNDGSIIEGAVAAFLYDMIDPANESHDFIDYPGSYIADIVETCDSQFYEGDWIRADGVDHLVYCFERAIDPDVTGSSTYFDTRDPDPVGQRESANEPPSWNRGDIRTLWLWDLYEDEWDGTFNDGGGAGGGGSGGGGGGCADCPLLQ